MKKARIGIYLVIFAVFVVGWLWVRLPSVAVKPVDTKHGLPYWAGTTAVDTTSALGLATGVGTISSYDIQRTPLLTADVMACSRRSTLFDESKEKKDKKPEKEEEEVYPEAGSLQVGEGGYIFGLYSSAGRVYVNRVTSVYPKPSGIYTIRVMRVADGLLVACDKLWVIVNEGSEHPSRIEDLIPVVGKLLAKK